MDTDTPELREQRRILHAELHVTARQGRRLYRNVSAGVGPKDHVEAALAENHLLAELGRGRFLRRYAWLWGVFALMWAGLAVLADRRGGTLAPLYALTAVAWLILGVAAIVEARRTRTRTAACRGVLERFRDSWLRSTGKEDESGGPSPAQIPG